MTAPGYEGHAGNRWWEARSSSGRQPIFANPSDLWGASCEYFKWVEDNPLWETKAAFHNGEPVSQELPKMRAMTIQGLCLFLDISDETFSDYGKKDDFLGIVKHIRAVIYQQKLTGAAADLFNANIIARELGLKESSETKHSGAVGVTDLTDMTDEQLEARLEALINASANT